MLEDGDPAPPTIRGKKGAPSGTNRCPERAARSMGTTLPAPFMAMSFLALSVVPELKITDRGLVDTVRFELVPLEA